MVSLSRRVIVDRTPAEVFGLVSDPTRAREFFVGLTRWEPRSKKRGGVGTRYRVLTRVGSIEAGGTLAVTEWKPSEILAWESEDGIDQQGRWRLREASGGGTELTLEIEFGLTGPGAWLAERLAARVVGRNMTATLLAVRRILEFKRPPGRASAPG